MVSDFPAWGHSPSLRPRDLIKVKKNKLKDWRKLQNEPVKKSTVSILLWSSFNVLEPWTLVFIWKFRNNCFSKAAFNRPNQSVIIGIIYKWLANNCLIMKWPDFTTTGLLFLSIPAIIYRKTSSRVLFQVFKEFYRDASQFKYFWLNNTEL